MAGSKQSPDIRAIRESLVTRKLGNDSNELLAQIMVRWGGPAEFARQMYVEFEAAKAGSLIRQNILEMIQKLVVNNTNHNITQIVDPADLDDEDIERELDALMSRATEHHANAQPSTTTTASYSPAWEIDEPL